MKRPNPTWGIHHVALNVKDMIACERFYVELLGMRVEWRPDVDNLYLTSGNDNLALHRATQPLEGNQRLDHIGFIVPSTDQVNEWYTFLLENRVSMKSAPRAHRDGAYSFYCQDPEGNVIQFIHHPPLMKSLGNNADAEQI